MAVAHDQEIHFTFLFVAQIAQLKVAEPKVGPAFDRLEQMADDQGLCPRAFVRQSAPVAQEPLGLLAQRFGHVRKPGADDEAVMHPPEEIDPALDGVHGHLDFLGEVGIDKLPRTTLGQELHEDFQRAEVGDPSEFTQVFPRELLLPQRTPASREAAVPPQKQLRESTVLPERLPIGRRQLGGRLNFSLGQVRSQAFTHAPRMHAIEEITPHQAVAAPAENVQAGTAGYDQPDLVAAGVEEAFEQPLPFGVFVQLVQNRREGALPQVIQLQRLRQRRGTTQQTSSVVGIVPVQIGAAKGPAHGGLADLARTGNQGHLTMSFEVVSQDGGG